MKLINAKLAMLTGTFIIGSTLFAGTALASSAPTSSNQAPGHQLTVQFKNGSEGPITLSGSSPDMIKTQVESLVNSGKITQQMADKIQAFSLDEKLNGRKQNKQMMIQKSSGDNQAGDQLIFQLKNNGSDDPITISGSSPEMLKSQVQSLIDSGKITQQMADNLLNALSKLQSGNK